MDRFKKNIETQAVYKRSKIKPILLSLWLILWASNFSYSQWNAWRTNNRIEQINNLWGRNIETYRARVENRNNNIKNTNETLDDFTNRLWWQFEFEARQNNNISNKIKEIKNLLNTKYSKNITNDNPLLLLQTALKNIASMGKYQWLDEYTDTFSWKFDINFINAIWYIQFINNLSDNGTLMWENWELTLNIIINDLNNKWYWLQQELVNSSTQTHPIQDNNISQTKQVNNDTAQIRPKINRQNVDTRENNISSDYSAKVENRNKNIQHSTNETLEDFANRIHWQFMTEFNSNNSLISKKTWNIKRLLNNKFNQQINSDDPIIILQSALKKLSTTEKYKWLKEYSNKFSWEFDINFINAYWLIQYLNDWNCNWILCWNDWTLILQSIYDDLNSIGNDGLNDNGNIDLNNNIKKPNDNKIQVIEENTIDIEWINLLSSRLSLDKLNWVTYEDVWNTINWFKHEWLKNAVMACLLRNDVIWAQRLLWMDINCNSSRYPNYVASLKIWERELELMKKLSETRRYMDTQEILDFMERLEKAYEIDNYHVKITYLKFLSWELDNWWLPYCIISKYDYKIYLFSADHKLLSCQPVLTWAHIWDHPNNPMWWYHTTPWWMYEMWWAFDKSSEGKNLVSLYWTDYLLLIPKEWQYKYSDDYTMGMHGYVNWRGRRLSSYNTIDHRVSNWCINFDRATFWEIINHLKKWSKVYICRDDEIDYKDWLGYNGWEIEMIEYFWYRPQNVIYWDAITDRWYCRKSAWNTTILPRRILSNNSIVKKESILNELPYKYNLNMVTSSSQNNISNIFRQRKKKPYNQMYQKKYLS